MNIPGSFEKAIEDAQDQWLLARNERHFRLLRLVILRNLLQHMHQYRTMALALGNASKLKSRHSLETIVDALLYTPLDQDAIPTEPVRPSPKSPDDPRLMSVWKSIQRDDRRWEREIALEALKSHWQLSRVLAWIDVSQAQDVHMKWSRHDPKHAVVVFVESGPDILKAPAGLWQGCWYMVHAPAHPISALAFESLMGYSSKPEPIQIISENI